MQDQPSQEHHLTNEHIILFSTALEAKIGCLTDLAELYNASQDAVGVVACVLNLVRPLGLNHHNFPNDQRIPGDTERDKIIDAATERMAALLLRQEQTKHNQPEDNPPQPDSQAILTCQLVAQALQGLSDAHATHALRKIAMDDDHLPSLRWSALGIAQGIFTENAVAAALSITDSEEWPTTGHTGTTALQAIQQLQTHMGECQDALTHAAKILCKEWDIDEPSPTMVLRPGIISDTILTRDPGQRYQLLTDIIPGPHPIIDGVVFNYQGLTYLKTTGEPFPKGFPHPTAIDIAETFLSRCNQHSETSNTDADDLRQHRQDALDAMRLAQLQLHCITASEAQQFVLRLDHALPKNSDMTTHVMRLITAHANSTQDLLLRGELETIPLLNPNASNKVLKAAKSAGLRPAALWELAQLLNIDPDRYGISRPTMPPHALAELQEAALDAGIPDHIVAMVKQETTDL